MHTIIVVIALLLAGRLDARVGFKKDTSMERIEFPPPVTRSYQDDPIPAGHLRPLGYQRRPEGKVPEVDAALTPQKFNSMHVITGKPAVMRKLVESVPAMELWTDAYLKKTYGNLKIHVVVKKEQLDEGPQVMTFKKFLKEYQYEDWYLSNTVPEEMMKELILPSVLKCGLTRLLTESEIWMSSGGTSSLLHSHADHTLHCVLAGRKDFILITPDQKKKFEYKDSLAHPGAGHSDFDMDMINMFAHKQVARAPWHWATLHPGDCIYIPAGHPHQVRSWGRSFSSTTLWAPSVQIRFDDCSDIDLDESTPLDTAPFMWTYTHGDRELSNIKLNGRSLQNHLKILMRLERTLRFELFRDFYEEVFSEQKEHTPVEEVWEKLAGKDKMEITRSEFQQIKMEVLDKVAKHLNYAHTHKRKRERDEL